MQLKARMLLLFTRWQRWLWCPEKGLVRLWWVSPPRRCSPYLLFILMKNTHFPFLHLIGKIINAGWFK